MTDRRAYDPFAPHDDAAKATTEPRRDPQPEPVKADDAEPKPQKTAPHKTSAKKKTDHA